MAGVAEAKWAWPKMTKQEWGPRGWNWLHLLAINYRHNPSVNDARLAFRRLWEFVSHLPCETCRAHATAYVLSNPPNLANTYSFQIWAWKFHNNVNERLKKPQMSFEDYRDTYYEEISWSDWHE